MAEEVATARLLRFGVFELDLQTGELRKSGKRVRLAPQPFRLLVLLASKPGQLVTREEIEQEIWGGNTVVDYEQGLRFLVKKTRAALGDHSESPRYIETLPRRGYRFIGPVEAVASGTEWEKGPATATPRWRNRLWLIGAGLVAIAAVLLLFDVGGLRDRISGRSPSHVKSIAVLPLENLSHDPGQEYFADGMTEALIMELSKFSQLQVIGLRSVMVYKGSNKPVRQIARELNVDAVMEGSVLHSGDRVRIDERLVDGSTERILWKDSIERNLGDVLVLTSNVARAIAREVRIKVTPEEQQRMASARRVNTEAFEAYLQGRRYFRMRTLPAFKKSIQFFQRALRLDPQYAAAYSGLSESYGILPFYGGALPRVVFPKAKVAVLKALEIDSTLAEAHAALGNVLFYYDWDWPAAESEFKRAIELKPSYVVAHHWYAEYLTAMGRHEQAFAEIRRAQELDPVSPLMRAIGGEVYTMAHRPDQAIDQCRKGLELESNFGLTHRWLGMAYLQEGMYQQATAEFEEVDRLIGRDNAMGLARAYAMAGRRGEAVKMLDRFNGQYKQAEVSPMGLAAAYTALGEKQRAIDWLQKAYEQRDPFLVFIRVHWAFDSLHSDPRFQSILRRMNFPQENAVATD
jgi:TolB-like protein/DNA-binding winged helix-turn-helix (wHTH) protein/tetratricopeptide (TPR) repeat protein